MKKDRKIILDIETTGLDPKEGHRIIEIGCIELLDGMITQNNYHIYINPECAISEQVYQIHGLSYEFLKNYQVFSDIVDGFLDYLQDSFVVAHNAKFDIGFLNYELALLQKPEIAWDRVIDTLPLARQRFPGERVSLDALCKKCNVSLSNRHKHSAIVDAKLLAQVYPKLVIIRQLGIDLGVQYSLEKTVLCQRVIEPTEQEFADHLQLLSVIKSPLWMQEDI